MSKVELVKYCIENAEQRISKLTPEAINVPMLGSLQIRHLLNNLGSISSVFLDVGSHVGGSFCSAVFCNGELKKAYAVDSWESDKTEGHLHEGAFRANSFAFTPYGLETKIIKSDCFSVDLSMIDSKVDFYSYDAGHSLEQQKEALIYYKRILADEFIYVCDDWMFEGVKEGTMQGIEEGGYEILFQRELVNDNGELYQNEQWWDGYAVFVLKKK